MFKLERRGFSISTTVVVSYILLKGPQGDRMLASRKNSLFLLQFEIYYREKRAIMGILQNTLRR